MGTFLPKAEGGGEESALVVASQHHDLLGAGDLHSQDKSQYFDREVASVDIVS